MLVNCQVFLKNKRFNYSFDGKQVATIVLGTASAIVLCCIRVMI